MKIWPRTLFGRLAALLATVVIASQIALMLLVVNDRLSVLARNYAETQLPALTKAIGVLRGVRVPLPDAAYGLMVAPTGLQLHAGETPPGSIPTGSVFYRRALEVWRAGLGAESDLRYQDGERPLIWVSIRADGRPFWLGMPAHAELAGFPWRVLIGGLLIVGLILAAAYGFAARLTAPITHLHQSARAISRGEEAPPVDQHGPVELVELGDTLKRTADELRRIERERAVWLAGISHDIRGPLTKLRLGIDLAPSPDSDDFEAWGERMSAQVEAIDRVVEQFISYARLTQGDFGQATTAIGGLVTDVVTAWRKEGRNLIVSIADGGSLIVRGESESLRRAFDNLVDNAYKYGARTVRIEVWHKETEICCRVSDDGPGLPDDLLNSVHRAFHRGSMARGGPPGSGLGLAIVNRVVRWGGGSMVLENLSSGGLSVLLRWPDAGQSPEAPAEPS